MIAIYDFTPHYCPHCGYSTRLYDKPHAADDYGHGASHQCLNCGVIYQYARTEHIADAASKSGGDLAKYAPRA